jgi:tetratricopeptide (TPR) repeat protein
MSERRSHVFAAAWLAVALSGTRAVTLQTSESSDAQAAFHRGITALHYFEYEDANEAFRDAARIDPSFAMAHWGEAMTYHQTLWRNENVPEARRALARLAPTPAGRIAKARTPKEQAWLDAVEHLFGDADADTRRRRYADAMAQFYAREPGDPDVASLYALALLGTMSRSLIGFTDAHEGHSQALAGSEVQTEVRGILERVLQSHPEHPGALHYLLHNQDDPQHAKQALAAARTLARIAPASSHARHMPAHIFLQLGLWHDAALSDRSAFAESASWVARKRLDLALRNYHALSWLQYELLQLGRYREARATMDELEPVVKASGQLGLLSDLSSMRARYVIESAAWTLLAGENNFGNVNELFAIGVSAAYAGDVARAERARRGLADRAQDPREGDLRPAIAIMELELVAAIAHAAGRGDEAVRTLQTAAEREAQLPAPLGLPAPIKPAAELLGEVLVAVGRPSEAVSFFAQTLLRYPNRSLSVLGLARAASAAGNPDAARRHYAILLTNYDQADADLPVLREARAALERPATPALLPTRLTPLRDGWLIAAAALATLTLVIYVRAKTKKRGPVSRAPQKAAAKRRKKPIE